MTKVSGKKLKPSIKAKLSKLNSSRSFKHSRFSRANLTIFTIIFAAIGCYFLFFSHAATLVGDINSDGTVDATDFSFLVSSFGQATHTCTSNSSFTCDLNNDNKVDFLDVSVLISNWGQAVTVTVSPSSAAVLPGGTQQFSASVNNATNQSVTWSVQEGASGGTINSSGLYTAPATQGTYHVVATSVAFPGKSSSVNVTVGTTYTLPSDRSTTWNPGIVADTLLNKPLDPSTRLPVRTTVCANEAVGSTAAQIQSALNSCPKGQVVQLAAGSWTVDIGATNGWGLQIPSGVVLRGAGRYAGGTHITLAGATAYGFSTTGGNFGSGVSVTSDVAHGATQIPVSNATNFAVGDLILIDQLDDSYVVNPIPDQYGFNNPGRSVGQLTEVIGKSGNNLIISTPIHLGYKQSLSPLVYRFTSTSDYVGLEDINVVTTATSNGNGLIFFGDGVRNSWVKNIELSRASWGGLAVDWHACFRCVLRDSYIHDANTYSHGGGSYQVRLMRHTSESLVENNVIRHADKLLLLAGTGGGNVIGYNFIDWGLDESGGDFQETTIDMGHASFPQFDLVEGNQSANASTENDWGNQGWMTVFRNNLTAIEYECPTYGCPADITQGNKSAIQFEAHSINMNAVGNVLGTAGIGLTDLDINLATGWKDAVWRIGQSPNPVQGGDDKSTFEDPTSPTSTYSMMLQHGNFDNVSGAISWDPAQPNHNLPPSLYLTSKPAFFGTNGWPYVNPTGSTPATRVGYLPAYERWVAGSP
jgi:hypothetical protein